MKPQSEVIDCRKTPQAEFKKLMKESIVEKEDAFLSPVVVTRKIVYAQKSFPPTRYSFATNRERDQC